SLEAHGMVPLWKSVVQSTSTTLLDPAHYSGLFSRMAVKALYRWCEFGTLARGDRSHGDRARSAPDSLARTISTLLRPSRAAARAGDVRAWPLQRQRSEVDAGDVGPRHQPDHLPRLSALHHARGWGRRSNLAASPRGVARAARRVDHRRHQLSQAGHAFGRRRTSVLWRARQGRQLPSRDDRRAVDRCAGVADRCAAVSPEGLAQRSRSTGGGADSRRDDLSGEMASGAHLDPTRARGWPARPRGARGRRVWRRDRIQASAAPLAPPVCRRDLAASHRVSGHAGGPGPAERASGPAAIAAGARARYTSDRGTRVGVGFAEARLATGDVAQRDEAPVGGRVRRRARHPGQRLARATAGARGLALVRTGSRRHAADQILLRGPARHRIGEAVGPTRPSALGDRATVSRAQD